MKKPFKTGILSHWLKISLFEGFQYYFEGLQYY